MMRVGSSRSSRIAPIEYVRIGPTPCVSTSHPPSVSIGGPQLPSCNASHACVGSWHGSESGQMNGSSANATEFDSRSDLDIAANRPRMRRGHSARPLFAAAFPTIGLDVKDWKSVVSSSCWLMWLPLYAVYVA